MSKLNERIKRVALRAEAAREVMRGVDRALVESEPAARQVIGRHTPGDAELLRGIPVVGVRGGKGGAITGTRPEKAIDRIERHVARRELAEKVAPGAERGKARQARQALRQQRRRRTIIERDKGRCYLCGSYPPVEEIEIDHVIPKSKGGGDHDSNLAVACATCNRSKGARMLTDAEGSGTLAAPD